MNHQFDFWMIFIFYKKIKLTKSCQFYKILIWKNEKEKNFIQSKSILDSNNIFLSRLF